MSKVAFAGLCVGAAAVGSGLGYLIGKYAFPDQFTIGNRTYRRKAK